MLFTFDFKGTAEYAQMMKLLKEIYHHEQCSPLLRTFIKLRVKQIYSDEELEEFLKED